MRRWAFHILTMFSTLLCAVVLVLWVRSYFIRDRLEVAIQRSINNVYTENGRLIFWRNGSGGKRMYSSGWIRLKREEPGIQEKGDWFKNLVAIRWQRGLTSQLSAPLWFVGVVLGVLPAFYVIRRRVHRPDFPVEESLIMEK